MAEIKDRIIFLRTKKNITQGQLAKILKISASSIGMYEQGRRKPSYELLEKISDYFNVDMDYLMARSDIPNRYQVGLKYDWEEKEKSNVESIKTILIPMYGVASAGNGYVNLNDDIGTFPVQANSFSKDAFAIKVNGDSMTGFNKSIPNGCTAIVEPCNYIYINELFDKVCVLTYDNETYIKQLKIDKNGKVRLKSFNPEYDDIIVENTNDLVCNGRVVATFLEQKW